MSTTYYITRHQLVITCEPRFLKYSAWMDGMGRYAVGNQPASKTHEAAKVGVLEEGFLDTHHNVNWDDEQKAFHQAFHVAKAALVGITNDRILL